ncbi:hypothetical protein MKZ38_000745 [Zalerion maritima]|uniref:N-acetyltransferase domain-containing protein n=1 Tax=Zalerion maritima TaxID=339359 RepID=A0AAD5RR29_9PEZI|nr:hypothetical protein MKZ38_000745 [Zalerion maritima]
MLDSDDPDHSPTPLQFRVSGEPPFPPPEYHHPPPLPLAIQPRHVILRDRQTLATVIPFASRYQVPQSLLSYLCDQFNKEIEGGDTYPMTEPMMVDRFGRYWFQNFGAIMLLGHVSADEFMMTGTDALGEEIGSDGVEEDHHQDWTKSCLGSFYIKPNYPGRSSHVCNAGFIVTDKSRNRGIGRLLAEIYIEWAPRLGYTYSVFNLVYETNVASCKIWDALGFKRIGRVKACGDLKSYPDRLVDGIIYGRDVSHEEADRLCARAANGGSANRAGSGMGVGELGNEVSDDRFDKIAYYLRYSEYPRGSNRAEKSRLRAASTHYKLVDDKLMLKGKEVISDPKEQVDIVARVHDKLEHSGINKTTTAIAERYHWGRIKETVSEVVRRCDVCRENGKMSGSGGTGGGNGRENGTPSSSIISATTPSTITGGGHTTTILQGYQARRSQQQKQQQHSHSPSLLDNDQSTTTTTTPATRPSPHPSQPHPSPLIQNRHISPPVSGGASASPSSISVHGSPHPGGGGGHPLPSPSAFHHHQQQQQQQPVSLSSIAPSRTMHSSTPHDGSNHHHHPGGSDPTSHHIHQQHPHQQLLPSIPQSPPQPSLVASPATTAISSLYQPLDPHMIQIQVPHPFFRQQGQHSVRASVSDDSVNINDRTNHHRHNHHGIVVDVNVGVGIDGPHHQQGVVGVGDGVGSVPPHHLENTYPGPDDDADAETFQALLDATGGDGGGDDHHNHTHHDSHHNFHHHQSHNHLQDDRHSGRHDSRGGPRVDRHVQEEDHETVDRDLAVERDLDMLIEHGDEMDTDEQQDHHHHHNHNTQAKEDYDKGSDDDPKRGGGEGDPMFDIRYGGAG